MQCVLDQPVNDRRETVKLKVQYTESQIRYVTYQLKAKLLLLPHFCVPHLCVPHLCVARGQNLGRIGRPS